MSAESDTFSGSAVFWLRILLEAPLIVRGFWYPQSLPFSDMNETTLVLVKVLSAMSLGTCLTSLKCYFLPDFFPGKRAVAMGLFLYHTIVSIILVRAPRFIPVTSSLVWGPLHGVIGLWFGLWWVWGWINPPKFPPIPFLHIRFSLSPPPPPPPPTQPVHNIQARPRRRRGRH